MHVWPNTSWGRGFQWTRILLRHSRHLLPRSKSILNEHNRDYSILFAVSLPRNVVHEQSTFKISKTKDADLDVESITFVEVEPDL